MNLSCVKGEGSLVQGASGCLTLSGLRNIQSANMYDWQLAYNIDSSEGRKSNAEGRARNKEREGLSARELEET